MPQFKFSHRRLTQCVAWAMLMAILIPAGATPLLAAQSPTNTSLAEVSHPPNSSASSAATAGLTPVISFAAQHDTLPALRQVRPTLASAAEIAARGAEQRALPPLTRPRPQAASGAFRDPALVNATSAISMPAPIFSFEGLSNVDEVLPPDTEGDIGLNHYMQWNNVSLAIWEIDRASGNVTMVYGPVPGNTLWQGFGGVCEDTNDGDPIVLYDHLANRWMASQLARPNYAGGMGPFYQCIAISQTDDPTAGWHRYAFKMNDIKANDYSKFGVWPDAYYMTINQFFIPSRNWGGAGVVAFERDQMLRGQPARMVMFDLYDVDPFFGGILPADLDGPQPPVGTPNYFVEIDDDAWGIPTDQLSLWEFRVDWTDPSLSTFGMDGEPTLTMTVPAFDTAFNCGSNNRMCIPQPSLPGNPPSVKVDAIAGTLMHRLQYRNFGAYQTLVVNHTVDAGDFDDHAAVRWYELRSTGTFTLHQSGTYAPDATHRWMGSAAMDASGNLAIGYSASSNTVFPSVRYAGRFVTDTLGTLPLGEMSLVEGTGYQTSTSSRWGDYSAMGIDPTDDCTFWYTQEYYGIVSEYNWQTRIGAFKFPNCTSAAGAITGTVSDAADTPLVGATVWATNANHSARATANANGTYRFSLPVGVYSLQATALGYASQTLTNITVTGSSSATHNFKLSLAPTFVVSGTVRDANTNWPLYARIDIDNHTGPIFNNPVTGFYSVTLGGGANYNFRFTPLSAGYNTDHQPLFNLSANQTLDSFVATNASVCTAPGYQFTALNESFDAGTLPAGWTLQDNMGNGGWAFDDPGARSNRTGSTGGFATVDSDFLGSAPLDAELRTPVLNLTGEGKVFLVFDTDFRAFDGTGDATDEVADIDVSTDGGTSWVTVRRFSQLDTFDVRGHKVLDVSNELGGQAMAQVRFRYYNAFWDYWWQIDNVKIGTCAAPPGGGLVVGNVTDMHNGQPVLGALVSSAAGTTARSETTGDPNNANAVYKLYVPNGTHVLTATLASYAPVTTTVTMSAGATLRRDFNMSGAFLTFAPASINASAALGTNRVVPLTLTENSGLAAQVYVVEQVNRAAITAPTEPQASAGQTIKGSFSPLRLGVTSKAENPLVVTPRVAQAPSANWQDIASFPVQIQDNTAATYNGLVYSVGGYDGASILNSVYSYNPTTNAWTTRPSLAYARQKPAAAFVGDKLYVVGGWSDSGNPVTNLEVYSPTTNVWVPGLAAPKAYAASAAAALNGHLYVIGGCDASSCGKTDVWRYDPVAITWTLRAPYPEATSWLGCGTIDGLLYCAGGVSFAESKSTYVYDPYFDTWTRLADMPATKWAMGYASANGRFIVSGGVTGNFTEITASTFAYDPQTNTWTNLPDANNTLYRGASACGFYRIGGSSGGFAPTSAAEMYPGLTDCQDSVNVPWLSVSPSAATVTANGTRVLSVTLSAALNNIDQPGTYSAQMRLGENTPYKLANVPVTFTVTAPASWGYLTGNVTSRGYCDAAGAPAPITGAQVMLQGKNAYSRTIASGDAGAFAYWVDAANAPLTITVNYNGYVARVLPGVSVSGSQTTTQAVDLRLDRACATPIVGAVNGQANSGSTAQQTLVLTNTGAGTLTYSTLTSRFSLPTTPNAAGYTPLTSPEAPDVAWYGGQAAMGGMYRYAHAQCPETPDVFYVFSGIDSAATLSRRSWRFDASANQWTALAAIPEGAEGSAAVCYAGSIYVMGGDSSDKLWVYNITADAWAAGPTMPRMAQGAAAAAWNGKLFLLGGDTDANPSNGGLSAQVDTFDVASNTWLTNVATLPITASNMGFAQAGPDLYLVGGYGNASPSMNLTTTVRYNLATNTSAMGPAFTSGRADLALAVTNRALYALGGDHDGGGFVDATTWVERLDWTTWATSTWTTLPEVLPSAFTGNTAGYCTNAVSGGEVWSVGGRGADGKITGGTLFHPTSEACYSIYSPISWLQVSPAQGMVGANSTASLTLKFDARQLVSGTYTTTLVLATNDLQRAQFRLPVTLTVGPGSLPIMLAPALDILYGDPGVGVTHTLWLTNTGDVTDTFDLTVNGAWTTAPLTMTVGPLGAGMSATVQIRVNVPLTAAGAASDGALVNVLARTSQAQASAALVTIANNIFGVQANVTQNALTGKAGNMVTYTLHLTNTGNAPDKFTLNVTGGSWPTPTPLTTTVVAAGASLIVDLGVTIPLTASNGAINTSQIAVTSVSDAAKTAAPVTVNTTVQNAFLLYLPAIQR